MLSILLVDNKANFSHNFITSLDFSDEEQGSQLIILDLSYNSLERIGTSSIKVFSKLEELYLHYNNIRSVGFLSLPYKLG